MDPFTCVCAGSSSQQAVEGGPVQAKEGDGGEVTKV